MDAQFVFQTSRSTGHGVVLEILPARVVNSLVKKILRLWFQHHQRLRDSLFKTATSSFNPLLSKFSS